MHLSPIQQSQGSNTAHSHAYLMPDTAPRLMIFSPHSEALGSAFSMCLTLGYASQKMVGPNVDPILKRNRRMHLVFVSSALREDITGRGRQMILTVKMLPPQPGGAKAPLCTQDHRMGRTGKRQTCMAVIRPALRAVPRLGCMPLWKGTWGL